MALNANGNPDVITAPDDINSEIGVLYVYARNDSLGLWVLQNRIGLSVLTAARPILRMTLVFGVPATLTRSPFEVQKTQRQCSPETLRDPPSLIELTKEVLIVDSFSGQWLVELASKKEDTSFDSLKGSWLSC